MENRFIDFLYCALVGLAGTLIGSLTAIPLGQGFSPSIGAMYGGGIGIGFGVIIGSGPKPVTGLFAVLGYGFGYLLTSRSITQFGTILDYELGLEQEIQLYILFSLMLGYLLSIGLTKWIITHLRS